MPLRSPLTIALVAGETSGDILGADLIKALKKQCPTARFIGIAGPLMQAEGCEAYFEMHELEVMGIVEVLGRLPRILMIRRTLLRRFLQEKPDIVIGIDAPDFNLPLEKRLKQQGIKTVHYVSPSIWAWRQRRIFTIAKATHLVLALLPFEKKVYDHYGVPCRFIGHTLADAMPLMPDKLGARNVLGIAEDALCLALLPGSRVTEITLLAAIFMAAAALVKQDYPQLHIIVPMVNAQRKEQFLAIKQQVAPHLAVTLVEGQSRDVLMASDVALLASGTATLECMLAKCPMVVGYRMHPATFWLAQRLVKIPYISLPNLLAEEKIVAEYIQDACEPTTLAQALLVLLGDRQQRQRMQQKFVTLHHMIRCQASEQAAQAVLQVIQDA